MAICSIPKPRFFFRLRRTLSILLLGLVPALTAGCDSSRSDGAKSTLKVAVSILPQADFVERIGGPHVEACVLVGPGQSPATYDPTPGQLIELSQANLLFRIGVAFEDRLLKKLTTTHPDLEIVDTRQGITLRHIEKTDHVHEEQHYCGDHDPHVWLDPMLVKVQSRTICDALVRLNPAHATEYERNLAVFHSELDDVHARISELLAPLKGKEFFVFHPAFGYFADAYGLKQVAVENGGKEPSPKQLVSLIERARKSGVRLVFVQKQFTSSSAEAVAEAIGGRVVTVDPLARNYLDNLEALALAVAKSFQRQPISQVAKQDNRKSKP